MKWFNTLSHNRWLEQETDRIFDFGKNSVVPTGFGWLGNKGNDSNLLIVFYVQIMPDDFVMQLHRF